MLHAERSKELLATTLHVLAHIPLYILLVDRYEDISHLGGYVYTFPTGGSVQEVRMDVG